MAMAKNEDVATLVAQINDAVARMAAIPAASLSTDAAVAAIAAAASAQTAVREMTTAVKKMVPAVGRRHTADGWPSSLWPIGTRVAVYRGAVKTIAGLREHFARMYPEDGTPPFNLSSKSFPIFGTAFDGPAAGTAAGRGGYNTVEIISIPAGIVNAPWDAPTPVKTPVVKTPVVKTPVVKTPVVKTPVVKTPVVKTPDPITPDPITPDDV